MEHKCAEFARHPGMADSWGLVVTVVRDAVAHILAPAAIHAKVPKPGEIQKSWFWMTAEERTAARDAAERIASGPPLPTGCKAAQGDLLWRQNQVAQDLPSSASQRPSFSPAYLKGARLKPFFVACNFRLRGPKRAQFFRRFDLKQLKTIAVQLAVAGTALCLNVPVMLAQDVIGNTGRTVTALIIGAQGGGKTFFLQLITTL
jgi:hypothetical protein